MQLEIHEYIDREICHYASPELRITSKYNRVFIQKGSEEVMIQLPLDGWKRIFGRFRLSRRALRLDKCNVVPVQDGFVAIRQGKVYHYNDATKQLRQTLNLQNCRNVLHQSIAVIHQKELYFGEYGNNPFRFEVPVYRSMDCGLTWEKVFTFPAGKIKHVHGCYYDPMEEKIWTLTGDFEGECYLLCSSLDFSSVEWIGDGSQAYRACNVFFEKDSIHWIMDSQLQQSHHMKLDRKTRTLSRLQGFPGPVWYIKKLEPDYYLAATAQEIGTGVRDGFAHLMLSRNLKDWEDLQQFSHDGLPKRWLKFGVIGFADGTQTSHDFYLFAEALRGMDGKTVRCSIES